MPITFPVKIPCTGCWKIIDAASAEELEAELKKHVHYIGIVDPDAGRSRYDEGYAKGFAAGFESARKVGA